MSGVPRVFTTDLGSAESPEADHGTRIRCRWLIKEVIPRQTGKGVGKQKRKREEADKIPQRIASA